MWKRRISAGRLKRGKMDRRGQENLSEGGKGMWHGDMAGAKAGRKRSERFTWNGVEDFKRRAMLGNNGW